MPSIVALPSSWLDLPVTGIAAYGIPIGAFVGFAMAPRVIGSRSLWRPAILSAVVAVLVAIVGYCLAGVILGGTPPFLFLLLLPFITFFAFVIGLPVTLPMAFVASFVLRRLAGEQQPGDR